MTGCDLQQIAIERRLHGDLGDAEAAALEAHLQGCADCRGYLAQARATEAAMGEQVQAMLQGVDWEKVRRSAARQRFFWKEEVVATAGGLAAVVAATAWLLPAKARAPGLAFVVATAVLALVLVALRARAHARGLGERADPIELLAAWRTGIRRDLTSWRRMLWLYLVVPAGLAVAIAIDWPDLSGLPFFIGLAAVSAALAAYDLLVRLPRVRRELADLELRGEEP
jgi:hypothetical protein